MPDGYSYTIVGAPQGGFVVYRGGGDDTVLGRDRGTGIAFACTDIDDALGFIKGEMMPASDTPSQRND